MSEPDPYTAGYLAALAHVRAHDESVWRRRAIEAEQREATLIDGFLRHMATHHAPEAT